MGGVLLARMKGDGAEVSDGGGDRCIIDGSSSGLFLCHVALHTSSMRLSSGCHVALQMSRVQKVV